LLDSKQRKTDAPLKKKADRICQLPEADVPLISNEAGGSTAPEQSIACGDGELYLCCKAGIQFELRMHENHAGGS
jgi:hypothetical protein